MRPWFVALGLFLGALVGAAADFPAVEEARAEESAEAAQRVTFEFQGVNILDVLKLLSKRSGLNIVAGKNVQGQVSIFLQDVEVMDALATILETSDLAYVKERGIIKVMTQKDYEDLYGRPYQDTRSARQFDLKYAKAQALAETLGQMKSAFGRVLVEPRTNTLIVTETPEVLREMEALIRKTDRPSVSKVFRLRHAKVEDLESKLAKLIQEGQGSLEVDKKSNRVFARDTKERVEKVARVIKAFDVRQPQVLIEAKVMEVKLSDEFRLGIDWQLVLEKVGSLNTLKTAAAYAVAPPAGATLTTLALGSGLDDLQVLIQAIEKMGKTNTLSSPRLTVLNNAEAKLAVATREPFVSQTVVQSVNTSTTADNVQFVDVGVTLTVIPEISVDDYIQMKIKPEISTAGTPLELQGVAQGSNTAFTRTRVPVVTTQELETTVMVKSGTMLVIGGLIQDKHDKTSVKLPVLGSLPFLGRASAPKLVTRRKRSWSFF
ncbi:MAG: hypothetical protein HY714_06815 [Candidatus Omnitrophica bacterium]|nr:hypothetical protein [Candidatus Omnitrophota bacterium]